MRITTATALLLQSAADTRMQQATANLLADMGALPRTLQPGLVAVTPSRDTIAPTSTFLSPSNHFRSSLESGVTCFGIATEAGGGP